MTQEKAWETICNCFNQERRLTVSVIAAFVLILSGCSIIAFNRYVGLGFIATGILLMTVTTHRARNNTVNPDLLYTRYFLTEWLKDYFEEPEFSNKYAYSDKELDTDWQGIVNSREFGGRYRGIEFRAAQVFTEMEFSNGIKDDENADIFEGRIWEFKAKLAFPELPEGFSVKYIEDKTLLFHNLYRENSPSVYWMPSPTPANMNIDDLEKEVRDSVEMYLEVIGKTQII